MSAEEQPLSVAGVIEATQGTLIKGDRAVVFTGVSTDSRSIKRGELFIALRGVNFDGHRFCAAAIERGAAGAIVEQEIAPPAGASVPLIKVQDTLQALGDLANWWRKRHPIPLIAIVGSTGKTTTKEMAAGILKTRYRVMKNEGNFNNLIGLPLSLMQIDPRHEVAILEMGMNRKGEIRRLTRIAEPDTGILTNIGPVHLEGVGSIRGVMEAKGELVEEMNIQGRLIVNADDPLVIELGRRFRGERIAFGVDKPADWTAHDIFPADGGVSFALQGPSGRTPIALQLMGRHQVYNALAAAAAAFAQGVGMEEIKRGLEASQPPSMRMEIITLGKGVTVINDAYNANPKSMEAALLALAEATGGKKIAVLGDMWELGPYAEEAHRELGRAVQGHGIDTLVLLGQFAPHVAQGAREAGMDPQAIYLGKDHRDVSLHLAQLITQGDWVLLKGSRIMKMEEIVKELEKALGQKSLKT
jgi:UDP-N-acetylmuramoyl-tripeptide--D-alanyl-D-alanine ligase